MNQVLRQQLAGLPRLAGVYQFFDGRDWLLYVGKAKNLRSRVNSYFHRQPDLSPAKQVMIKRIHHLQITTVKNEDEALLWEGSLIKQHQPPYNVVLKDDKSWLYFAIDYREPYPPVALERRPATRGVRYFGPYASATAARDSFHLLKKILGLKTCPNPPDKPCFASTLGRCLGHNLGPGSRQRYRRQLHLLEQVLRGHVNDVVTELERAMAQAARQRHFEQAAKLRDYVRALRRLAVRQSVISPRRESYDVFGLARGQDTAAVVKLPVRRGVLLDGDRFLVDHTAGLSDGEVLEGFIGQYYPQVTERPRQAYVLTPLADSPIPDLKFITPQRGTKRSLAALANSTAALHLDHSAASWERREARARHGLKELQELLRLPTLPQRIEGYDISNLQGREAVGSMVVLTNGLPEPSQYRKFKIENLTTPNDFAMLAQVLERRFVKNTDWPKPDLVMLDGGAGQLSVVERALARAGITVPLVALAKREELLYLPQQAKPVQLPADSPALQTLQSLRDEAHRFGITFHRQRRAKRSVRSLWDELPGVGPVLKRKLKAAFGTPSALRRANATDLAKVVGSKLAERLRNYLMAH